MKRSILLLSSAALLLSACSESATPTFEPAESEPQPQPQSVTPALTYAERINKELAEVRGSPAQQEATDASPATYQIDVWLHNSTMEQAVSARMVQDVEITARLYPQLAPAANNGKLARDTLAQVFSRSTILPSLRLHLAANADAITLRRANEIASTGLVRQFLLAHAASTVSTAEFETFVKAPIAMSGWRSAAVASIAYATAYASIDQAALTVIPKLMTTAGQPMSPEELVLLDKRAGALTFSRVAYSLREFSDDDIFKLQNILTAEPQLRKLFEATAIGIARAVAGLSIDPSALSSDQAAASASTQPTSTTSSLASATTPTLSSLPLAKPPAASN